MPGQFMIAYKIEREGQKGLLTFDTNKALEAARAGARVWKAGYWYYFPGASANRRNGPWERMKIAEEARDE